MILIEYGSTGWYNIEIMANDTFECKLGSSILERRERKNLFRQLHLGQLCQLAVSFSHSWISLSKVEQVSSGEVAPVDSVGTEVLQALHRITSCILLPGAPYWLARLLQRQQLRLASIPPLSIHYRGLPVSHPSQDQEATNATPPTGTLWKYILYYSDIKKKKKKKDLDKNVK